MTEFDESSVNRKQGKFDFKLFADPTKAIPGPPLSAPQLAEAADQASAVFFDAEIRRNTLLTEAARSHITILAHEMKTEFRGRATHFELTEDEDDDGTRRIDGVAALQVGGGTTVTLGAIREHNVETSAQNDWVHSAKVIGPGWDMEGELPNLEKIPYDYPRAAFSIAAATSVPLHVAKDDAAAIDKELDDAARASHQALEAAGPYIAADLANTIAGQHPTATHIEPLIEVADDGQDYVAGYRVIRQEENRMVGIAAVYDFDLDESTPVQHRLVDHVKTLGTEWSASPALNLVSDVIAPTNPHESKWPMISIEKALAAHQ